MVGIQQLIYRGGLGKEILQHHRIAGGNFVCGNVDSIDYICIDGTYNEDCIACSANDDDVGVGDHRHCHHYGTLALTQGC